MEPGPWAAGNGTEEVKEPYLEADQAAYDHPIPRFNRDVTESDAAEKIAIAHYNELSNCGPNGQNVLHVAALRSKDLTQKVLERRSNLRCEVDDSRSTPLHFAGWNQQSPLVRWLEPVHFQPNQPAVQQYFLPTTTSATVTSAQPSSNQRTGHGVTRLLVEADATGTMTMKEVADSNGMCPIHIAASVGAMDAIRALVSGDDDDDSSSAALLDANRGTFLHVAVENQKTDVVRFVCRDTRAALRSILNTKDKDGNTALHLAVQNRDESSFNHLVGNRHVELNHVNKDGYTPLDLASKIKIENSFASLQNPTEWMIRVLAHSGAYFSTRRRDLKFGTTPKKQQDLQAPSAESSAPSTVMVASALIATVTFAAAFNMPGSYNKAAGTPALGSYYGFKVFLVADILAFYCSVSATFSLAAYGTQMSVDPLVRRIYTQRALWFFHIALKSVIVAFALGVTVVIWDISLVANIIVALAACAVVLYGNKSLAHDLRLVWVMYRRFGLSCSWTLYPSTSAHLDWNTWRLRSFSATVVWNLTKLFGTYIFILLVAYIAQLKQKVSNY